MEPLPFDPVELVAIDDTQNVRRRWRIAAYRDLFGRVMIETDWGRIGTGGQALIRSFADEGEAQRYVRGLLMRRGTASRRIGVAYEPRYSQESCGWQRPFTRIKAMRTDL